jgi:chemotaxis protein histidine kinase CheA
LKEQITEAREQRKKEDQEQASRTRTAQHELNQLQADLRVAKQHQQAEVARLEAATRAAAEAEASTQEAQNRAAIVKSQAMKVASDHTVTTKQAQDEMAYLRMQLDDLKAQCEAEKARVNDAKTAAMEAEKEKKQAKNRALKAKTQATKAISEAEARERAVVERVANAEVKASRQVHQAEETEAELARLAMDKEQAALTLQQLEKRVAEERARLARLANLPPLPLTPEPSTSPISGPWPPVSPTEFASRRSSLRRRLSLSSVAPIPPLPVPAPVQLRRGPSRQSEGGNNPTAFMPPGFVPSPIQRTSSIPPFGAAAFSPPLGFVPSSMQLHTMDLHSPAFTPPPGFIPLQPLNTSKFTPMQQHTPPMTSIPPPSAITPAPSKLGQKVMTVDLPEEEEDPIIPPPLSDSSDEDVFQDADADANADAAPNPVNVSNRLLGFVTKQVSQRAGQAGKWLSDHITASMSNPSSPATRMKPLPLPLSSDDIADVTDQAPGAFPFSSRSEEGGFSAPSRPASPYISLPPSPSPMPITISLPPSPTASEGSFRLSSPEIADEELHDYLPPWFFDPSLRRATTPPPRPSAPAPGVMARDVSLPSADKRPYVPLPLSLFENIFGSEMSELPPSDNDNAIDRSGEGASQPRRKRPAARNRTRTEKRISNATRNMVLDQLD